MANTPSENSKQNVEVFIRVRPLLGYEHASKCLKIDPDSISVRTAPLAERKFHFDGILTQNYTQTNVYKIVLEPQLPRLLKGYNCTVVAYGSQGSGKTHTIFGDSQESGLIQRVSSDLFETLDMKMKKTRTSEYTIFVSAVEITNEIIKDLAHKEGKALVLYNDPLSKHCVKDVTENYVSCAKEVTDFIAKCLGNCTQNSHRIFTFTIKFREINVKGEQIVTTSKLNLLDLGCNDAKSKAIQNLSNVVRALAEKHSHIPYRDSKLTRVLQDGLGGESYTTLIATISQNSVKESLLNTLEFAHLARTVENTPKINVSVSQDATMSRLVEQGAQLKRDLEAARRGEGFYITKASYAELESENRRKYELVKEQKLKCEDLREAVQNHIAELHRKKAQLQEEQRKIEEQGRQLQAESRKFKHLNRTKDELFELFQSSSKQERIYHEKYLKQTAGTVYNAELAQQLALKNVKSSKQLEHSTKQFGAQMLESVSRVENILKDMKEKQESDWNFVKTQVDNYKHLLDLNTDGNVESVRESIQKLLLDHYTRKMNELKASVKHCEDQSLENVVKMKVQKELIKKEIEAIVEVFKGLHGRHAKLMQTMDKSDGKDQEINGILKKCLELGEDKHKKTRTPLDTQNPGVLLLNSFKVLTETQNQGEINHLKSLDHVKIAMDQSEANLQSKHTDNVNNIGTYIDYHLNELQETVKEHTAFITAEIDKESKDATENHSNITGIMEKLKCESSKYVADFDVFVQQSQNELESLAKGIVTQVHEGDTPVKKVYDVPENCNVSFSELQ